MNRYTTYNFLGAMWLILLLGTGFETYAQYCVDGSCNGNTYLNSSDPNTLEYDNMVSSFHATIVKEYDGKVLVWGQGSGQTGANVAPPLELNGINYGIGENKLTGSVLKFTIGGAHQFAVLTTEGLYIWGTSGALVATNIYNVANNSFRKVSIGTYNVQQESLKSDGLPQGVQPTAVKMMFGTGQGLAIVTCDGQAWVLASNGDAYGDGAVATSNNNRLWHRVSTALDTPLENVVAVRGTYQAFMALTAEGKIYTWGVNTRLGNNTGASNRKFATLMTTVADVTPKMIGMTRSTTGVSYYLLGTNGRLYTMGDNSSKQLGDNSTIVRNSWYNVVASSSIGGETYELADNIAWISPQEHYNGSASINVLTKEGKLWAWGYNQGSMLGGTVNPLPPTLMPGSITGAYNKTKLNMGDLLMAVETGGHTSLLIKQCATKFGYVGHQSAGSMSDHPTKDSTIIQYNFGDTSELSVCGAVSSPMFNSRKTCNGSVFDLTEAIPAVLPSGSTGIDWWMDANGTIPVVNPEAVMPGTYYGTFKGLLVKCPTAITISFYTASDPEFKNCESHFISNPLVRQLMQNATDATEQRNQFISR